MPDRPFATLPAHCAAAGLDDGWSKALCALAETRWTQCNHGDLPRWLDALSDLPEGDPRFEIKRDMPSFGAVAADERRVSENLQALHPWRKGPIKIAGIVIDTEWRSDWKWARIAPHLDLRGATVLDVGCGNGYYGWRMLAEGARLVIGIDPTWVFVMQWLACRHFSGELPNFVLPLGVEHLPTGTPAFDAVCSMGVLYHRRDASRHLERLHSLLRRGGTLVLETLVLPDAHSDEVLQPKGRYARMRNVWAIPGCERLLRWAREAGFHEARVVDVSWTTTDEQRSTPWMTFESLDKALDPADVRLTVEGLPAPRRAVVIARR